MRVKRLLLVLGAAVTALAIGAVACDESDGGGSEGGSELIIDGTVVGGISVEITSPEDGATVTSPVTLEVSAEGVVTAEADEAIQGAVHFVAFDSTGAVQANVVLIPEKLLDADEQDEDIHQFAEGSLDLPLSSGEHTVAVALADNHDRLLTGPLAQVTFTVEEGGENQ